MSAVLIGYGNQDVLYMLAELCSRLSYFHLLSLAATADHLPPPHPIPSILLCYTSLLYVLHIHESSPWSSFFPIFAWHLHVQNPFPNISTVPPSYMPRQTKFISTSLNLSCPFDVLKSILFPHYKRYLLESLFQHLQLSVVM